MAICHSGGRQRRVNQFTRLEASRSTWTDVSLTTKWRVGRRPQA